MGKQIAEALPSVNIGGANVTITAEQYREYKELQAKRDRSLSTLRAQMKVQEAEWSKDALRLARAVTSEFCKGKSFDIANEILAHE